MTPDALYGIEIKSDADTYARLSGQVKDYDKYYDYNYVVVGTSHALHIREHVPAYWGVITVEMVDDRLDFYILRQPQINPKVIWKKEMEILWRPELAMIADERLRQQISEILFERDYTTVAEELSNYRKEEKQKRKRRKRLGKHGISSSH